MSSPRSTAAAFRVRPAPCATASPALCSRLAITAPSSRRPASSRAIRVWSSARSTVSRRPASVRSSPSAKFREIYMQEEGPHLRAFFLLPTALSPAVPAPHRLHRVRQAFTSGVKSTVKSRGAMFFFCTPTQRMSQSWPASRALLSTSEMRMSCSECMMLYDAISSGVKV